MGLYFVEQTAKEMASQCSCGIAKLVNINGRCTAKVFTLNNPTYGIQVNHMVGTEIMASWQMAPMPGNDRIVVFTSAWTHYQHQNKGIGRHTHQLRLDYAKLMGAAVAMCTVNETNDPELKILQRFGWTKVHSYQNDDNETVGIYTKSLVD